MKVTRPSSGWSKPGNLCSRARRWTKPSPGSRPTIYSPPTRRWLPAMTSFPYGRVARRMWNFLWPEVKEEEVKIGYITNGVHTGTWLARRMGSLYTKHLGKDWRDRLDDPEIWEKVLQLPVVHRLREC